MLEISRTEVHKKLIIEFRKEEIISIDTPRDVGKNSMIQEFSSNSKNDETHVAENLGKNWRRKNQNKEQTKNGYEGHP